MLNRTIILAAALGLAGPALAQQAPPSNAVVQTSLDQLVTIHANLETQLAKQLDAANAKIAEEQTRITGLEKQVADLQKQIDAAKPKVEPTPAATEPTK